MKRFSAVLALALSLAFVGPAFAGPTCVVASKEAFLDQVKDVVVKIHVVPKEKLERLLKNVNAARPKNFPLEADAMLVGELNDGRIGTVMFKDDCVVPGTAIVNTLKSTREALHTMGAEDILSEIGTDS